MVDEFKLYECYERPSSASSVISSRVLVDRMDCPKCGLEYELTEQPVADLWMRRNPEKQLVITCPQCGAQFKLLGGSPYEGKWEEV